jgi:hypothetical protein
MDVAVASLIQVADLLQAEKGSNAFNPPVLMQYN